MIYEGINIALMKTDGSAGKNSRPLLTKMLPLRENKYNGYRIPTRRLQTYLEINRIKKMHDKGNSPHWWFNIADMNILRITMPLTDADIGCWVLVKMSPDVQTDTDTMKDKT